MRSLFLPIWVPALLLIGPAPAIGAFRTGADLAVTISGLPAQVSQGDEVHCTLHVTNLGPDAASGVTAVFPIPAGTTFVHDVPFFPPSGGQITYPIGTLAPGGATDLTVNLTVNAGPTIVASASVTGAEPDPVPSNNNASATSAVFSPGQAALFIGADDPSLWVTAVDRTSGASQPVFQGAVRALASDDANRRFFYSTGPQLFSVPYDEPRVPVLVGALHGDAADISGGLAWDSMRSKLYASNSSSLYEVDPDTARTRLVRAVGAGDFSGLDYDPVTDRLIATNNSPATTNGLSGRGVYAIDPRGSALVFLAAYPFVEGSTRETDLDGCAVGGGFIYPVADEEHWLYRFNRSSQTYLPPYGTGFGVERTLCGATWSTEVFTPSPGANLAVTIAGPGEGELHDGDVLVYIVRVTNLGPSIAGDIVLTATLPAGAEFQGSSPPLVPLGGVLTLDIRRLYPQSSGAITVYAQTTPGRRVYAVAGHALSSVDDPFESNNDASRTFMICAADFNRDGVVNSQDFFAFLAALFSGSPYADFNADGAVNSQDFFDFLAAFFAGCG